MGWEYALVDAGWDAAWIPQLTAYARARDVGVLLWARWDALTPPAAARRAAAPCRDWGVAGVKLDYMESDSFQRMRWYRTSRARRRERRLVVTSTARRAARPVAHVAERAHLGGRAGAETYKGRRVP